MFHVNLHGFHLMLYGFHMILVVFHMISYPPCASGAMGCSGPGMVVLVSKIPRRLLQKFVFFYIFWEVKSYSESYFFQVFFGRPGGVFRGPKEFSSVFLLKIVGESGSDCNQIFTRFGVIF